MKHLASEEALIHDLAELLNRNKEAILVRLHDNSLGGHYHLDIEDITINGLMVEIKVK